MLDTLNTDTLVTLSGALAALLVVSLIGYRLGRGTAKGCRPLVQTLAGFGGASVASFTLQVTAGVAFAIRTVFLGG